MTRSINLASLALGASLAGIAGCSADTAPVQQAQAADTTQAAAVTQVATVGDFTSRPWKVTQFECNNPCDHRHFDPGDVLAFKDDGGKLDFFVLHLQTGKVERTAPGKPLVLGHVDGAKGPIMLSHEGGIEKMHWLILRVYPHPERKDTDRLRMDITVCATDPGEKWTCDGDQHGGVGHADD